ncbi:hypothetical protein [Sodaliphilus pleomorphus]|uniref:hypothetical protein n=1 Tax=Sodaliphilus pleomorphus TaxID=2606626 RepID=UPI00240912F0|nr:hypothetical protein [Sodaliphilus pleomorphus]
MYTKRQCEPLVGRDVAVFNFLNKVIVACAQLVKETHAAATQAAMVNVFTLMMQRKQKNGNNGHAAAKLTF